MKRSGMTSPVSPWDNDGVQRLSQYIVRAPISQERIIYIPEKESLDGVAKVVYEGKTTRVDETFTALDWAGRRHSLLLAHASWFARLVTHIPNKGEQMVRYYGYYSNKSRGILKKDEINNGNKNQAAVSVNSTPVIVGSGGFCLTVPQIYLWIFISILLGSIVFNQPQ